MRTTTPAVVVAVVSIAIGVAGCGGSGNKGSGSTSPSPAASSMQTTAATPTTSGTPTTSNAGHVAKSAQIASSAYYNFALEVTNNTASYLSATQAKFAAHCIQNQFLAAGYKTQADVEKAANGQKVHEILTTCFLKGRYH